MEKSTKLVNMPIDLLDRSAVLLSLMQHAPELSTFSRKTPGAVLRVAAVMGLTELEKRYAQAIEERRSHIRARPEP